MATAHACVMLALSAILVLAASSSVSLLKKSLNVSQAVNIDMTLSSLSLLNVVVGSYCNDNDGLCTSHLHSFRLDPMSGKLDPVASTAAGMNCTFVVAHRNNSFVCPNEAGYGRTISGLVRSFRWNEQDNSMQQVGQPAPTNGNMPPHISLDQTKSFVLVANYGSGSVSSIAIAPDGVIEQTPVSTIQVGGNPHSIYASLDNKCVLSPNIGLDRIFSFKFESSGKLQQTGYVQQTKGTGPRHIAFNPMTPKYVFVLNEPSAMITSYTLNEDCTLTSTGKNFSTLRNSDNHSLWHAAEVRAVGKFLWATNRFKCNLVDDTTLCNGSIATFEINDASLSLVGHVDSGGHSPRVMQVVDHGRWMIIGNGGIEPNQFAPINQHVRNIRVVRIDQESGIPGSVASSSWDMNWANSNLGSPGGIAIA